jgi:hypothetical protein
VVKKQTEKGGKKQPNTKKKGEKGRIKIKREKTLSKRQ